MMGEFGSGDKSVSMNHHIQESGQKRPCSVLRDCGEGTSSDRRIHKKIKGADYEATWCLSKRKATGEQHGVLKKPSNHRRTKVTQSNVGHVCNKAASRAVSQCRSATLLTLRPFDPDDDHDVDDEVVRDGGDEKKKEGSTKKQQSKNTSITPENYQSEAERVKSFVGKPVDEAVHPEQRPNRQPESLPVGSNTQNEEVSKHSLQFPDYSAQAMRTRLKPFIHYGGSQELGESSYMITHRQVVQQDWKRSDNVVAQYYEYNSSSFMGANKLCIATPESCSTSRRSSCQRDAPDGFSRCFRSPTQSQSGSTNTAQCPEQITFKDSQQETENSTPSPISFYYQRPMYYHGVEGTLQRITPSHTLVPGIDNASVLEQDPLLSGQVSSNHPLDVSIHSQESRPRSHTSAHSGHVVEIAMPKVSYHPSLGQNQLLPNSDNGQKETVTPVPNQGQHQPLGTSRKVSSQGSDESFYSTEYPHDTVDPPRTKTMYEESISEGLENQYLPNLS